MSDADKAAPSKLRASLVLFGLVIAVVIVVIAAGFARWFGGPLAEAILALVLMVGAVVLAARVARVPPSAIGLARPFSSSNQIGLLVGTLGGVACAGAAFGISLVFGAYHVETLSSPRISFVLTLTVATLIHATFEEVAFRAGIVGIAARAFPRWAAISIPAALFAAAHLINPGVALLGVLNTFLLGIVLGMLYLGSKPTLGTCSGWHFGWNIAVAFVGTPVSGHARDLWLHSRPVGDPSWTGGRYGIEASLSTTIIAVALLAGLGYSATRRNRSERISKMSLD